MKIQKTIRGFDIIKFKDSYGVECSLQKSSSAEDDKIWLGCDNADPKMFVPDKNPSWRPVLMPDDYIANTRMHLTREQVKSLLPYLQRFAETGDFTDE